MGPLSAHLARWLRSVVAAVAEPAPRATGFANAAEVAFWSAAQTAGATADEHRAAARLFSEYLTDARYGWAAAYEEAFGQFPVPICHEWNTIAQLNDYEGSPEARPLSRQELQHFLDYADDQVERAAASRRKGGAGGYRDATLFKVIYGVGRQLHGTGGCTATMTPIRAVLERPECWQISALGRVRSVRLDARLGGMADRLE